MTKLKNKDSNYFKLKKYEFIKHLKKLDVKKNDTVLVHSNISEIGFNNIDFKSSIDILHSSLTSVIGANGTICVPSFYWDFNKKKNF